jgi:hypothetical protein
MLDSVFIAAAIALRLIAGADYLVATAKGSVRPNPITWLFWGLTPLIAFLAQVHGGFTPASLATLALSIGPLLIFVIALTKKRRWRLGLFDILCGVSAAVGLVLWQITNDPLLALTFGILADILGGLPTVYKAYIRPQTEKALPYILSAFSMIVTMMTLHNWSYLQAGFPVYIFCINALIASLIIMRRGRKPKGRPRKS